MSYARFLAGDVYVFMNTTGSLECCGCIMDLPDQEWSSFLANSTQKMVDHLEEHTKLGHFVPWGVVDHLWADDSKNFPL